MGELLGEVKMKENSKTKKVLIAILIAIVVAVVSFVSYEIATVNNTYYISQKNLQIPIFVYHDLVENESEIEFAVQTQHHQRQLAAVDPETSLDPHH